MAPRTTIIRCLLLSSAILLSTSFRHSSFPIISRPSSWSSAFSSPVVLHASTSGTSPDDIIPAQQQSLSPDRYVITNRFQVRPTKGAKFEKRWATRKSRLATLDGFRYFHLMRRVSLDSSEDPLEDTFGNYVSLTVWQEKKHFDAWRKGDAFKEAHGGTSITAFLSTMVKTALILKGPPRPAFYDGLLFQSVIPDALPDTIDGWRNVNADGINRLPTECFIACNQFYVPNENAMAFEQRWANRVSTLREYEGFVAFGMLRRDIANAKKKGHGAAPFKNDEPTYVSTTIWRDRECFNKWREGSQFKSMHGQSGSPNSKPLWTKPPSPVFYEGTLVISSEEGA